MLFELTDHLPSLIRIAHGEDIDQAARKRKLQDAHIIVEFSNAMHIAKTDQAARMRSTCCRNTSAQPYRGTHIYAPINEYHWTMSAQSERGKQSTTCAGRLLDNHVVISESRKSRLRSLVR